MILSQSFDVKVLVWKSPIHLIALGASLALWECVGGGGDDVGLATHQHSFPNLGVWVCVFLHSLPAVVDYATMSPCKKYLATLSEGSDLPIVRVYHTSFATDTSASSPLKRDLDRLLGRSLSQSLEFFGKSSALHYHSCLVRSTPSNVAWRMTDCIERKCNALIVTTVERVEYVFVEEESTARQSKGRQFTLCHVRSIGSSGAAVWWLNEEYINLILGKNFETLGENSTALLLALRPDQDLCLMQLSNIDNASSSVVTFDILVSASCNWPGRPTLTESSYVLISQDLAFFLDFAVMSICVAKLIPASMPFNRETSDFNYETIAQVDCGMKSFKLMAVSPIYNSGCASASAGASESTSTNIETSQTIFFSFKSTNEIEYASIASFSPSFVYPSTFRNYFYCLRDGRIFIAAEKQCIDIVSSNRFEAVLGEVEGDSQVYCAVVTAGSVRLFMVDLTGILWLPEEHFVDFKIETGRIFGKIDRKILAAHDQSHFYLKSLSDENNNTTFKTPLHHPTSQILIDALFSYQGDLALILKTHGGPFGLRIITPNPSAASFLHVVDVESLSEMPLGMCWSLNRDFYVATSYTIVKYSAGLSEWGLESWSRVTSTTWPTFLPLPLKPTSFSIFTDHEDCLWTTISYITIKLSPLLGEIENNPGLSSASETNYALRCINFIISDHFDRLEYPHLENQVASSLNIKIPLNPTKSFSFFEDVAFLDFENTLDHSDSDLLHIEGAREQSSGDSPVHSSQISTSRASLKLGKLLSGTFEAIKLVKDNFGFDPAGAKYLYFSKLSWEAAGTINTHGFEFLAASISDAQELLITKAREIIGKDFSSWKKFSHFGFGFWVKNVHRLREILEDVARTDFNAHKDPESCAILYLILGRTQILKTLWKGANIMNTEGSRMISFLGSDFSDERIKSVAAKNAFAALGKQRNRLGIIFFILAGRVEDALQVCFERLQDLHLGYLIARFLCDDHRYQAILAKHVVGNKKIPICIRGLIRKANGSDTSIFQIMQAELKNTEEWVNTPGLCLPLAVAHLKKMPISSELIQPSIVHLCKNGCFSTAAQLAIQYPGHVSSALRMLVEMYDKRWS